MTLIRKWGVLMINMKNVNKVLPLIWVACSKNMALSELCIRNLQKSKRVTKNVAKMSLDWVLSSWKIIMATAPPPPVLTAHSVKEKPPLPPESACSGLGLVFLYFLATSAKICVLSYWVDANWDVKLKATCKEETILTNTCCAEF